MARQRRHRRSIRVPTTIASNRTDHVDLTHINAFTAAMARKDLNTMLTHMADDIVLRSPLAAEAFHGKAAVRPVVEALFKAVDTFDFQEIMQGPRHVSSFFKVTSGPIALDGVDYWRLDAAGMIKEMTVLWRPFPAVAAVNAKLG
jgi:limonene-1,2-epoxide hydrolase